MAFLRAQDAVMTFREFHFELTWNHIYIPQMPHYCLFQHLRTQEPVQDCMLLLIVLSLRSPLNRTSPHPTPFFFHAIDHFEESRPIVVWSGPFLWTLPAVSSWPRFPLPPRWDGAHAPVLHSTSAGWPVSTQFDLLSRGTCQISSTNRTPSLPSLIL